MFVNYRLDPHLHGDDMESGHFYFELTADSQLGIIDL